MVDGSNPFRASQDVICKWLDIPSIDCCILAAATFKGAS
jgi:hypothetical protein